MATRVEPIFVTISGLPGAREGDHTYPVKGSDPAAVKWDGGTAPTPQRRAAR